MAQLVKCLPCEHTDLSPCLRIYINKKLGMVIHAGNPRAGEVEVGEGLPGVYWAVDEPTL